MKTDHLPSRGIITALIAVIVSIGLFIYTWSPLRPAQPDYNVQVWHSNPDLIHLSGKYRVIVYNERGDYLGYLHLSRTEMKRPLKIVTDYRFEEFGREYSDAR